MTIFSEDFHSIVINETPLIDVRAPIEFQNGAFKNTINLPILNNEERHQIGICYKNEGNAKAIELGYKIISGATKESRVESWCDFKKQNPSALLYCFRGGERSKISQQWMSEMGVDIVRLKGGYKAFRNYLLSQLELSVNHFQPIIISGLTGSGKTALLQELDNAIDLEQIANHRGSSFGKKNTAQPTQINFENNLAYELIQKLDKGYTNLIFEDEGKNIGTAFLPKTLATHISKAPIYILETPLHERIDTIFDEYVAKPQQINGFEKWKSDIQNAILNIQKRLGYERYQAIIKLFDNACSHNDQMLHKRWIEYLLQEYYDPMYSYQIQKKINKVYFSGNKEEILYNLIQKGVS